MFVDTAKVLIAAGKGGDGAVSFRHEIYVDKGGPDGGDGGKGGDVIFVASEDTNTLADFRFNPNLKAEPGQNGSKAKRHGKSGEHLRVKVPVGTIVWKASEIIADLTEAGQEIVVAHGGDGGFGNALINSSSKRMLLKPTAIVSSVNTSSFKILANSASVYPSATVCCGEIPVTMMASGLGKVSSLSFTKILYGSPIGSRLISVRCPANCMMRSSRALRPLVSRS